MKKTTITLSESFKLHILFWTVVLALLIGFMYSVRDILSPFLIGLVVAYLLDPLCDRFEAMGLSRTGATLSVTCIFVVVLLGVMAFLIPHISEQVTMFLAKIPMYKDALEQKLATLLPEFSTLSLVSEIKSRAGAADLSIVSYISDNVKNLLSKVGVVFEFFSVLLITPVVVFYLLRDWDIIVAKVDDIIPRRHQKTVHDLMNQVDERISGFLRGQSTVCLILGVFYAIALSVYGLEFGLLIGLFTGLMSFIPYVGMALGMGLGTGVAVVQFTDPASVAIVVAIFVIGQFIEGNFLTPKLVGEKVGLSAVWVIFALMAGGALFGFVGLLFAIPIAATVAVVIQFSVSRYKNSAFYQ